MKTPVPNENLVCRVLRFLAIAWDRPLARHRQSCTACRLVHDTDADLAQRLLKQAKSHSQTPPDGMEDRIIAAVTSTLRDPQPSATVNWRAFATAAAAVALVATTAILALRENHRPPEYSFNSASRSETPRSPSQSSDSALPGTLWARMRQVTLSELTINPIEQEIAAVKSDAQTVLRFLALNFLPETATDRIFRDFESNQDALPTDGNEGDWIPPESVGS